MQSRLYHRPELHIPKHGHERKVGWLELFYDLIYVASIIQLGSALSDNVSWTGFLAFAGLMVPLFLTWTGFTFYSNRFVVDDFLHRMLVFAQMFAIGAMAVAVPRVFDGETRLFALAYSAARFVLVILYVRTWAQLPEARVMTRRWAVGFTIGAALWLASAWVPSPWIFLVWLVAMLNDLTTTLGRGGRTLIGRYPPDVVHLSERFGILILIVLGESFVKVLTDVSETIPTANQALMGTLCLGVVCSLWWIYYDDVAGSRLKPGRLGPIVWVYTHIPLAIAVTAMGVGIKKVVAMDPGLPGEAKYRWLMAGALALSLLSVAVIDAVTHRHQAELSDRARVNARIASAFVALLLAPAGAFMPAWLFVALVMAVCIAQVVFDLSMAPLAASPHESHHGASEAFAAMADPAPTPEGEADPEAPPPPRRRDISEAVRKGTPSDLRRDLYFHFMSGSWTRFFGWIVFLYLFSNCVFAALYMLEPGSLANMQEGSFLEAFGFSVQTMATIGYGAISPQTPYAHAIVTIEAAFGILGVALVTGLMFAKASRPRASVLFSRPLTVTTYQRKPALMFRVGNAKGNEIIEATMHVSALIEVDSPEGLKFRRLHDLKLIREMTPLFALSWTVIHVIDESSPLHGLDLATADQRVVSIICTMTGHDGTYMSTVHARHMYYPEDIRFGHRFVDVISNLPDGRVMVDYNVFHETEPEPAPPPAS